MAAAGIPVGTVVGMVDIIIIITRITHTQDVLVTDTVPVGVIPHRHTTQGVITIREDIHPIAAVAHL
jgi:hypothetical protein